jgi:hypothetical protein
MLDTNTVNFAINKMSQVWEGVAPQLGVVTEEYVSYIVFKAVVWFSVSTFWFIASILCFILFAFKHDDWDNRSEFGMVVSGFCFLVFLVWIGCCAGDMFLALKCPEMFTINNILQSAK